MSVPVSQRGEAKLSIYTKQKKIIIIISYHPNHASKGNSFLLLQRMDKYYKNLWSVIT